MFHHQEKKTKTKPTKPLTDLTRILPHNLLLAGDKRQMLVAKIKTLSDLEDSDAYEALWLNLIHSMATFYQSLPDANNAFYTKACGLIENALNRAEAALSLLQDHLLKEDSEKCSEIQQLWQYALFSAALLQGIGKVYVDYQIDLYDNSGDFYQTYNAFTGPMVQKSAFYLHQFLKGTDPDLGRSLHCILAHALMPAAGFQWLASNKEVFAAWLSLLQEDNENAGILGTLLTRADAVTLQRNLHEFLQKQAASRGAHYGLVTGRGEGLLEKEQMLGAEFLEWLNHSFEKGDLVFNQSPVEMGPNGMILSEAVFHAFMADNPAYKSVEALQKGLLALGLATEAVDALAGEDSHRSRQIVLGNYSVALPPVVHFRSVATGKITPTSAVDITYMRSLDNKFSREKAAEGLNAKGEWRVKTPIQTQAQQIQPLPPGTHNG